MLKKICSTVIWISLIIVSNVNSQPLESYNSLKFQTHIPSLSNSENDHNDFYTVNEHEFKKPWMINKQYDDSLAVIDSAICMYSDGHMNKSTYTYNSNANMTIYLSEIWDEDQWLGSRRFNYTYDSEGNRIENIIYRWDESQWLVYHKITYNYDPILEVPVSSLSEDWDGNTWAFSSRATATYDLNGNRTSFLSENWDGSQWINRYRNTYTYNNYGNNTSCLFEDWNGSQWIVTGRTTSVYDSLGNQISNLAENWNGNQWVSLGREFNTYDSDGNITSYLYEDWIESQWVKQRRVNYAYDSNGNQTKVFGEYWDVDHWVNNDRQTYKYDSADKWIAFLSEKWKNSEWVLGSYGGMAGLIYNDVYGNDFFFHGAQIDLYYKTITEVNDEYVMQEEFSLLQNYPNPFNPITTIKYSIPKQTNVTLKVFDILGSEVTTLVNKDQPQGNYEVEFNGSILTSGIYFYRLQAGDFIDYKKMILLK